VLSLFFLLFIPSPHTHTRCSALFLLTAPRKKISKQAKKEKKKTVQTFAHHFKLDENTENREKNPKLIRH
jgi:hypothetical protein